MPAALLARAAHIDDRELVDWGSVAEPLGEPVSLTRGLLLHRDDGGGNETGLWVCTPGCWPAPSSGLSYVISWPAARST